MAKSSKLVVVEGSGAPAAAPQDASFPSPHIVYLAAVKNEVEAQLMRFRNGQEMLRAKLGGAQQAHEDALSALRAEYERKRQELIEANLAEVARLNTQLGDIADVVETYEGAAAKAQEIMARGEALRAEVEQALEGKSER